MPTVEPVVRQTLLSLSEVFLYTIPPLQKDGKESGHFADNWNLAKPLQRCSLQVQQKGHQVLLIFMSQKESEQVLFAHCTIDLSDSKKNTLADFFEPVLDSTRYFVIHITDETSDRKAHVGIGFREREDANHLKEILEDYAQAVQN